MSIKLYILPYKNTIIQLVTFVFSVRIAYQRATIISLYLIGETGLLNSPALGVLLFFKVNIKKKKNKKEREREKREKIKQETMRLLLF